MNQYIYVCMYVSICICICIYIYVYFPAVVTCSSCPLCYWDNHCPLYYGARGERKKHKYLGSKCVIGCHRPLSPVKKERNPWDTHYQFSIKILLSKKERKMHSGVHIQAKKKELARVPEPNYYTSQVNYVYNSVFLPHAAARSSNSTAVAQMLFSSHHFKWDFCSVLVSRLSPNLPRPFLTRDQKGNTQRIECQRGAQCWRGRRLVSLHLPRSGSRNNSTVEVATIQLLSPFQGATISRIGTFSRCVHCKSREP